MDPPGPGKPDTNCPGLITSVTGKSPGGQLAVSYMEGQIPGGEPDPPPRAKDGSRNSSTVGPRCTLVQGGEEMTPAPAVWSEGRRQ